MFGLGQYLIFTIISAAVMGASAIARDHTDSLDHDILHGMLTAMTVIGVIATICGIVGMFAVITAGVVEANS